MIDGSIWYKFVIEILLIGISPYQFLKILKQSFDLSFPVTILLHFTAT